MALLTAPAVSFSRWVLTFLTLDNWLLLGFGAFLRPGFTDGSTRLAWWGKP